MVHCKHVPVIVSMSPAAHFLCPFRKGIYTSEKEYIQGFLNLTKKPDKNSTLHFWLL